jgi:GNAT superfamily N-acetyltransferase
MHQPLIRPMQRADLAPAEKVQRIAFGTRFGLPDPSTFRGDAQLVPTRWTTDASTALIAEVDGTIAGGALGMDWGSVFIVGPIFVHPDHAGRGIARLLMQRLMELVDARPVTFAGLFTFPESAVHVRLYESVGFSAHMLTPVMTKTPHVSGAAANVKFARFSELSTVERGEALRACARITDATFPGLDLGREIDAVAQQKLGETILLGDASGVRGFAVCHFGAGSEGGSGNLFLKFAAVRPGAEQDFRDLLDACEQMAVAIGANRISAGTNMGRREAYRVMRAHGFRAGLVGVAMFRPDGTGYNRPDAFVVDDWR